MTKSKVRIGTRGSVLARAQTTIVQERLSKHFPRLKIEIVTVNTKGDRSQSDDTTLVGTKAFFTEDIEDLLSRGEIDLAVHSMKDLPSKLKPGLTLGATPPRGDPRDAFVSLNHGSFAEIGSGARIGTSSLRRKVQLIQLKRDVEVVNLRGNVETRVRKMNEQNLDGIVLAACVFDRVRFSNVKIYPFPIEQMIPAPGQGVIAVEARKDDSETLEMISSINDHDTWTATECERAFVERIGGDCQTPVAAHCTIQNKMLKAMGMIASQDGTEIVKAEIRSYGHPRSLGVDLANNLLSRGGKHIMEASLL
ncbi:MAG: hydroxymethylbilane synthase [Nitrososphaerota archaeon]|nr:hydroxymethylbilane synthase [Nitrososphaerota archaeon]